MTDPARLVALAAEVEKEGQYNSAKLLRAVAASLTRRASTELNVPTDPEAQASEIDAIADDVEATHASPVAAALRAAADAIRRSTVVLYRDAPDPFVCRICGHIRMEPFVERCPDCGRWPSTAERIRPIYWARASTPPESVALLNAAPTMIIRAFETGVPDVPGPDGGWTALQTLEHLHNAQSVFRGRIDQLLEAGEPELASVMVWTMDSASQSPEALLQAYLDLRAEILAVLDRAPRDAWWNVGSHEEFGRVTLAEQASYFANHEPTHLDQLVDAAAPRR